MNKLLFFLSLSVLFTANPLLSQSETDTIEINQKSKKMKVEIWSDIMCPFCYIGKRHFEAALSQFEGAENIEIEWKSFQLDPSLPKPSSKMSVFEYLADRKGMSLEKSKAMHGQVLQMAKAAGLDYNFDKAVVSNSFDAHRVIQFAKTKGLGDAAEERFFKAYFIEGEDMCDAATLLKIGQEIGLEQTALKSVIDSDQFSDEVKRDIFEAGQVGVQGVPFFVFDNKYAVSGAQPVSVFLGTLEKAYTAKTK